MDIGSFVAGAVMGIVAAVLFVAVIVPDNTAVRWMTWLAYRRNVPTMLLPVGVPLLLGGLLAIGSGVALVLQSLVIAWYWWVALIVGVAILLLWLGARRSRHAASGSQQP